MLFLVPYPFPLSSPERLYILPTYLERLMIWLNFKTIRCLKSMFIQLRKQET
jgi:hypothetical protein